jgi:hypothetical protein
MISKGHAQEVEPQDLPSASIMNQESKIFPSASPLAQGVQPHAPDYQIDGDTGLAYILAMKGVAAKLAGHFFDPLL